MMDPAIPSPASSRAGGPFGNAVLVLLGGAVTTLLTLVGVWFLNRNLEMNVMGWYVNWIIPAGALGTGAAASSGYGVVCWSRGVKVSGQLLVALLALQTGAYFAAQYIEYMALAPTVGDGAALGFWQYFDLATRGFAWVDEHGKLGAPLQTWGYGLRALELVGFSLGSQAAPLILRGRSYCEVCSLYMRSADAALVPASVPLLKFKKSDAEGQAAHDAEQHSAFEQGMRALEDLRARAQSSDACGFRDRCSEFAAGRKAAMKLPQRVVVRLARCPGCEAGELRFVLWSGSGQHQKTQEIGRESLAPFFARTARG